MDPLLAEALTRKHPVVFMDISIGGIPSGRIRMELFAKECPYDILHLETEKRVLSLCRKTVENFRQLCTGEYKEHERPVGYKASTFHRIMPDFMVQGGDFIKGDGTGRTCIYGDKFNDENFKMKHGDAGLLSMANSGPNSNGCQFFITCAPCEWLDGKHVVFGRVLDQASLLVVRKMESVPTGEQNRPKLPIVITECGEL